MKKGVGPHLLLALILSGCAVGPVYEPPETEIPNEWHSETPKGSNSGPSDALIWWECLNDPVLNELMAYAISQNLDLKIAAIRVLQAREEAKAKKGDLYPHIDGSANYGHAYLSKDGLVNGLLGLVRPIDKRHVKRNVDFYELGFDADWELDFWGYTAHEIEALKAHEEAVQENLAGVWVTLSAEIVKNYVELRGLQLRLDIMKRTIEDQKENVDLSQELLKRGVVNDSDYRQAQAELSKLKGEIPPIEYNIIRAIHHISILLGYPPADLFECLSVNATLPKLPCELSIGIPSELLRRRPDIRKAERELAAATERVGSAIAGLFPRFSLNGFVGDISTKTGTLFTPASAAWYAGPQMLVPIFNSRLLLQDVEYNKLATQDALYNYQKTVLEALEESENAIASLKHEQERFFHLREAYQHNQQSVEFSQDLYQRGVNDSFTLFKAKQSLSSAEDAMIQSQVELLFDYVALYKALGGSFITVCDE